MPRCMEMEHAGGSVMRNKWWRKIPWWGWALIVIAIIGGAYLKLKYIF